MERETKLTFSTELEQKIQQVAELPGEVLINGPTGSGKSEVARWIHRLSKERAGPFFAQNCATIPRDLAESTLFGHVRGAFTSADKDVPGIVAQAAGGTLFLDEIGELPLAMQAKLLTLLQDHVFRRVGSVKEEHATFRLIAATNKDLLELCNQRLFREDLYHRINVYRIDLPPLRDTPDRTSKIAASHVQQLGMPRERAEQALSAVARLSRHPAAWPGNVRELLTFLQRCFVGVEDAERQIVAEWARWRRPDDAGRLSMMAPSHSPSMADRERYAGLIRQVSVLGSRPKTAFSREASLQLASRLLDALPEPLAMDEVQTVLGVRDQRTLKDNVELLVSRALVERASGGIVAIWPPATSTLFRLEKGEWIPTGQGTIPALAHGDRIRITVTSRSAGTLRIMLITHGPEGASQPEVIIPSKELRASKAHSTEIRLDRRGGLEQILVHVGRPASRGGELVEPMLAEGIMPDSTALERGRRLVLDTWHEGWLTEHLVFHSLSS